MNIKLDVTHLSGIFSVEIMPTEKYNYTHRIYTATEIILLSHEIRIVVADELGERRFPKECIKEITIHNIGEKS